MGPFRKKHDPISEHERALNAAIAAKEAEIQRLLANVQRTKTQPHVRSTVFPHGQPSPVSSPPAKAPVFEAFNHQRITSPPEAETTPAHYNESGLRKFDLLAIGRRVKRLFRSPPPSNPQLINLLAAGSIRGVRPLRYEKRVARNRFIALVICFALLLWGLVALFFKNR